MRKERTSKMPNSSLLKIAEKIRSRLGTSISPLKSQAKSVSKDLKARYRAADSQELTVLSAFRKEWNPECFLSPKEACLWAGTTPSNSRASIENEYCGDILVLNAKKDQIALGIDVKMSSTDSRDDYYGTIQFSSLLAFAKKNPPKISKILVPRLRLFMCFKTNGEYKFVDPEEALEAVLSGKARLIASKNRGPGNYPRSFLEEVKSYGDKIDVLRGNGELYPQDFIAAFSQEKLMF